MKLTKSSDPAVPLGDIAKGVAAFDRLLVSAREALLRRPPLPWEARRAVAGLGKPQRPKRRLSAS